MKYVIVVCINILKGKFLSKKVNWIECIRLKELSLKKVNSEVII